MGESRSSARRRAPLVYHGEALCCDRGFEDAARAEGFVAVAGLDEVGRGALCGPVFAAAVVLGDDFTTDGLDDSKRLTARQRERLAERIRAGARAFGVGRAEAREIDRLDILRATHVALRRAVGALDLKPDLLLVDGLPVSGLPAPQRAIVKGDARSVSIAAASILAKVERDALMRELDQRHPGYGLAGNKGYGSSSHLEALARLGPCPEHRRSFGGGRQLALDWVPAAG